MAKDRGIRCERVKNDVKCDDCGILFNGNEHKDFYIETLKKCSHMDEFHKALVYCLGIDKDARAHFGQIYDLKRGCVDTASLHKGWQTNCSRKTIRLAFNLYCNAAPSVYDYENAVDQTMELQCYTVSDLFSCVYAPYFWQAVKLRYPEYCCL